MLLQKCEIATGLDTPGLVVPVLSFLSLDMVNECWIIASLLEGLRTAGC